MSAPPPVSIRQARGIPATVICLHASGSSGGQWSALREQLETDVRVLSPDLHGHGAGPSWRNFVEHIVAADTARIARIAESAPGDVHLVGHSYGGSIALRVALQHPWRAASVTVYEPVEFQLLYAWYGRRRPASEIIELATDMRQRLVSDDVSRAAVRFVEYWGGRGAWQALSPKQQVGITSRVDLITSQFDALADHAPRLVDYRSLCAPVLMLGGSRMHAPIRRIGELLRFALPNVTSHEIPAIGHMGPITHADTVAGHIAAFIRTHVPAPSRLASAVAA